MNTGAPDDCVAASARALWQVMNRCHLYIDNRGSILSEYRRHLSAKGQPGPGDAFLKWLLTHEWGNDRVIRVEITPKAGDCDAFEELPAPSDGTVYDPSDCKFLAVAAAHPNHPSILQSFDSKWWGWQQSLEKIGVSIHFLCPEAIKLKHHKKSAG